MPNERDEDADRCLAAADIDLGGACARARRRISGSPVAAKRINSRRKSRDREIEPGGDRSISDRDRLVELSQENVGIGEQVARIDVAGIQFDRASEIAFPFLPFAFAPMQVSGEGEKSDAVRHRWAGQGELFVGPIVVALATKVIIGHREMRFGRVGREAQRRLGRDPPPHGARRGWIKVEKIEQVVGASGVTIGEDETGIARRRIVQQSNRLQERDLGIRRVGVAVD